MTNIGLVDDRTELRETLKRHIELIAENSYPEWRVIDISPLHKKEQYYSWIIENNISILIVDERLNEVIEGKRTDNISYTGSELVSFLRNNLKDFPIYSITSYSEDNNLKDALGDFDGIVDRADFLCRPKDYVKIFVRSGLNYYKHNQQHLHKLGLLAKKTAEGIATKEEINELESLQTFLNIKTGQSSISRSEWLNTYEHQVKELKELSDEINLFFKSINK